MRWSRAELWDRFQQYYSEYPHLGLSLDISRMAFDDAYLASMQPRLEVALRAMADLEKGGIANPDENRMVGHYWLRNPKLAPTPAIQNDIAFTIGQIAGFAKEVHAGQIAGGAGNFSNTLLIGIGGSALGPQFVNHALEKPGKDALRTFYFDNTDPDGMDLVLSHLAGQLGRTLTVVVSKSGSTPETRNGMLEAKAAYERAGLRFPHHAVAITAPGSELDRIAERDSWLRRFPMWDWVGGRTSQMSAVGLLPAALQGIAIDEFLEGARACDEQTRVAEVGRNPAAQLALMWYWAGGGKGEKNMVILPYQDRLDLFSRYLQQLVMESVGKETDLKGERVHQGLTVFGNKGSTDQHAFVQQLRDGRDDFFVTFIRVLAVRLGDSVRFENGATAGDYLHGFLLGTRDALYNRGRGSITLTLTTISPRTVGALIALYERAVGLYAQLIHVNAYHQPGVEAGKQAATRILDLQDRVARYLQEKKGHRLTSAQIASGIGAHDEFESVFLICDHLAVTQPADISRTVGASPFQATYQKR